VKSTKKDFGLLSEEFFFFPAAWGARGSWISFFIIIIFLILLQKYFISL